jgi:hypothetical protein
MKEKSSALCVRILFIKTTLGSFPAALPIREGLLYGLYTAATREIYGKIYNS